MRLSGFRRNIAAPRPIWLRRLTYSGSDPMMSEPNNSHDLRQIARDYPDLGTLENLSEGARQELETKYRIRLQIADQALKEREIRLKEASAHIDRWANPLTVGIIAGALGLFANFANGLVSNFNERTKLQNELIKEATKPSSEQERAKSLVFFARNGLIKLDPEVVASLTQVAGSENPVPGSSSAFSTNEYEPKHVSFSQEMVDKIKSNPGVPYPSGAAPGAKSANAPKMVAIILHSAYGPDSTTAMMRKGGEQLLGPLAHWSIRSDGQIELIAPEDQKASHVLRSDRGISNANSIGIQTTGKNVFDNGIQLENLVRLTADVADRWGIPTNMILSHAEVSNGRKHDMEQQAPAIREMVEAVRRNKSTGTATAE